MGQELVIGGYIPGAHGVNAIVVGYYRGQDLICVAPRTWNAALFFANVMNGANVGMAQCRSGASLSSKAFEGLWVFGKFVGKEFKSNETAKLGVLGLVNHTHPATTEFFENAIVRDGLADERVGNRHSGVILAKREVEGNFTAMGTSDEGGTDDLSVL